MCDIVIGHHKTQIFCDDGHYKLWYLSTRHYSLKIDSLKKVGTKIQNCIPHPCVFGEFLYFSHEFSSEITIFMFQTKLCK